MDASQLRQFEEIVRREVPGMQILFKDESRFQKVLGFLSQPFNARYMQEYTSTLGKKVYFPSRAFYEKSPDHSFQTLAHEFVHIWDSSNETFFGLRYLFPQVLFLIPVLLYAVAAGRNAWILLLPLIGYGVGLAVYSKSKKLFFTILGLSLLGTFALSWLFTKWLVLLLVLGLAALGPWPAPWRVKSELRGYGMNVAILQWLHGNVSALVKKDIAENFSGPGYYYMSWDSAYVTRYLEATRQQAQQGALQRVSPFGQVHDFLYERGLIRRSS